MRFLLWKTKGDKALSEDILQETFVRFLLSLDRLVSEEDLAVSAYLFRTAKHCWLDRVSRSPHGRHEHVPIEDVFELSDPTSLGRQERAVELRELSVAMESLNEKESEIIWLRDALGFSHREVADQVGITETASRQAYVRAKRSLFSELSRRLVPLPEGQLEYANS